MTGPDFSKRLSRGLAWVGFVSATIAALDFVALVIILAKWVTPTEYGLATVVISLYPILDVATEMGLGSALIQRDDDSPDRLSTIFWLNLGLALLITTVLVVVGPWYGRLQGAPIVGAMLAAYGIKLVGQNAYFVPHVLMRKEFRYREVSLLRMVANVVDFVIKVAVAASGGGIWCFFWGRIGHTVVNTIGYQILRPWRPRFVVKIRSVLPDIRFGLKTSLSQFMFHAYTNADYFVVSAFFGPTATGLYRLAYELVLEPVRFVSSVVAEIAFPTFSRLRVRTKELQDQFVTFTRVNLVLVTPALACILVSCRELILLGWGEAWVGAATAVPILCVVGMFRAVSFVVPPLLDGLGYPSRTLVYTALAAIVLPALFVGFAAVLGGELGYLSVAVAWAVGYPIAFFVLVFLGLSTAKMHVSDYLRRTVGIPACTVIAGGAGALVRYAIPATHPALSLVVTSATILLVFGVLLHRFQGITINGIVRALRAD